MIKKLVNPIIKWIFPHQCVLCQSLSPISRDLCPLCENLLLHRPKNLCQQCGRTLAGNPNTPLCAFCLKNPPAFSRVVTLGDYGPFMAHLIRGFKFNQKLCNGKVLASLLAEKVQESYGETDPYPEMLLPVPLHPKRMRKRGFNQATLMANFLGKLLNIPVETAAASRQKNTLPQSTSSIKRRVKQMKNVFSVHPLPYQRIAIIDDVVTTGATVNALSLACQKSGVKEIHIWCLARTQTN